ncbi:hypothetical protein C5O75_011910 [Burkholderia cepacia]|uniref:hypothetical protein n=1 Tax=Burkholderia cepacia TaxID=292 RepID=UPI0011B0873A|nr:hypothetical protein [Burkholderia cepacia]KAB1591871.1 hypothetical protein C5O75_011910 [Burkholderia cepacia]
MNLKKFAIDLMASASSASSCAVITGKTDRRISDKPQWSDNASAHLVKASPFSRHVPIFDLDVTAIGVAPTSQNLILSTTDMERMAKL